MEFQHHAYHMLPSTLVEIALLRAAITCAKDRPTLEFDSAFEDFYKPLSVPGGEGEKLRAWWRDRVLAYRDDFLAKNPMSSSEARQVLDAAYAAASDEKKAFAQARASVWKDRRSAPYVTYCEAVHYVATRDWLQAADHFTELYDAFPDELDRRRGAAIETDAHIQHTKTRLKDRVFDPAADLLRYAQSGSTLILLASNANPETIHAIPVASLQRARWFHDHAGRTIVLASADPRTQPDAEVFMDILVDRPLLEQAFPPVTVDGRLGYRTIKEFVLEVTNDGSIELTKDAWNGFAAIWCDWEGIPQTPENIAAQRKKLRSNLRSQINSRKTSRAKTK